MRDHQSQIQATGAAIAAIGLGDAKHARSFRDETGITFPLLIDEKRTTYKAVGLRKANLLDLFKRKNFIARQEAKASGHRQYKAGKDPFQLGASFVFAPGNLDLFVHVSETFGDNVSVMKLLDTLVDFGRIGLKK